MTRRKTKEELNDQLRSQGRAILLVGDYTAALTKSLFECDVGHRVMMRPNDILNGHNCAICAGHHKTRETFNDQLNKLGRTERMVGEYLGAKIKTTFVCENGHEWPSKPNNILTGRSCPICADTSLTKDQINQRLIDEDRHIELIGVYKNNYTPTTFRCSEGHEWQTNAGTLLSNKSECPTCAIYGFSPLKPAHIYVIAYRDFIKYGVTNKIEQRLEQHRLWGEFNIIVKRACETGAIALRWENHVKTTIGGNYVSREIMGNGFTETLPRSKLNEVIETTKRLDWSSSF